MKTENENNDKKTTGWYLIELLAIILFFVGTFKQNYVFTIYGSALILISILQLIAAKATAVIRKMAELTELGAKGREARGPGIYLKIESFFIYTELLILITKNIMAILILIILIIGDYAL